MARQMRNVFDQFQQPENRLTHALMCSLHEDPKLLRRFVHWATGKAPPAHNLQVVEQSLPGQDEGEEPTEQQRRGLPDGWIFDDDGWALVIESKIGCRLEVDQIQRHRFTAQRRGFIKLHMVALVNEMPEHVVDWELKVRRWTELYIWLKADSHSSKWASRLHQYMEILEAKLVADESLKTGTLTVFTGIPFTAKIPYNYLEAKRQLRLAMDELRLRQDLLVSLGIDRKAAGRSAITGKDSNAVWDYLRLAKSADAKNFTEFPASDARPASGISSRDRRGSKWCTGRLSQKRIWERQRPFCRSAFRSSEAIQRFFGRSARSSPLGRTDSKALSLTEVRTIC